MNVIEHSLRPMRALSAAWNRFWFSPADPAPLGLMRIFVGGMLFYTHIVWGLNLPAYIGPDGFNGAEALTAFQQEMLAPSFWWYVPQQYYATVHAVGLAVLLAFTLGLLTRLTSILSLAITISYSYRAQLSNFGLDQISAILLLYLTIGPSGACYSLDAWLRRRRLSKLTQQSSSNADSSIVANLAIRLTQLHFCVIYFYAGVSKLQGPAWWDGSAIWMAFANGEYQTFDMTWVAWYPWIADIITHTTVLWEVSFCALIWIRPLRYIVLVMGALMHLGIGAMMGMWTFGLIMIFGHIAFWSPAFIRCIMPGSAAISVHGTIATPELAASRSVGLPPTSGEPITPPLVTVLCVQANPQVQLNCLSYFAQRNIRCLVASDLPEATSIWWASTPQAVVVNTHGLAEASLSNFRDWLHSTTPATPLFIVAYPEQTSNWQNLREINIHPVHPEISFGQLRREILQAIEGEGNVPAQPPSTSQPQADDMPALQPSRNGH